MARKKIAVVIRERQGEALRMAVGTILLDDEIHVYVLDRPIAAGEANDLYRETMRDLEMPAFSNHRENTDCTYLSTGEIAERLVGYDHVIAY